MTQEQPETSSQTIVADYARLLNTPVAAPDIDAPPFSTDLPKRDAGKKCALLLSAHPDDECLTGVLPLRLLREQNWQIINIALTLGSNSSRRMERKKEVEKACAVLGFAGALPEENGFSDINPAARNADADAWNKKVKRLSEIIAHFRPQVIVMPHANDGHATHVGTYLLGMDALALMPQDFTCTVALTEYWQQIADPNTMIAVKEDDLATLMSALACHAGENARNAYDRRFPALLIDTVRRGEILAGQGKAAPAITFGQMVKLGTWLKGRFVPSALNRVVGTSTTDSISALFA
ncbi:MAG: PIG-L family deacetylase [Bdellovibrionales bacterium]